MFWQIWHTPAKSTPTAGFSILIIREILFAKITELYTMGQGQKWSWYFRRKTFLFTE